MTVEDIYFLLTVGQKVILQSDKFTWYGGAQYIPTDYMEYVVVGLYANDGLITIDLGEFSE